MADESSQKDYDQVENLIDLSEIDEENVLQVLKSRYEKELIYTFIGNILVALNPYRSLDIYGINEVKKYENQVLGCLPPHLFAIGSSAFSKLIKDNESQLFIVSGESGSGKTESIKLILQYLAAVNKSPTNIVTEQILESSPLLEQFGNAKTLKNFNSSRFGKYLEIYFKNDLIIGANIKHYLLEKPRIVSQLADERVFHVFYEILAGFTEIEKEKYGLQSADKYFYLNQGSLDEIEGKNDAQDFSYLLSSFQVLGFTNEQQDTIFRILASVLHLGNIYFHRKFLKTGQEGVEIGTDVEIRWACHLLQLNIENVLQTLTCRITETREGDRLYAPYNIDQALDARDAIAKTLYDGLFTWLLIKLNEKTNGQAAEQQTNIKTIAMLDFFGFENLNENSFEQLCINYGNEKLHQHFIQFVFKLEQAEYAKEKIDCETFDFEDNVQVINLLVKKPIGIFPLLDDECNFPKASDQSFLDKCHYNHALNELYARPRMSSFDFGIKHFSGVVWYSADGFLDKNRDTLKNDVIELLISSKMSMVSKMFVQYKKSMELPRPTNTLSKHSSFKSTPSKSELSRFTQMKPRTPTISARFQESLNQLYQKILKINNIFYVCCLKPNDGMQPLQFDEQLIQVQMSNLNLVSIVRARKAGFPVKKTFCEFAARYRCLHGQPISRNLTLKEICELLLGYFGVEPSLFRFGLSKVFLKESLENRLELIREKVITKAVTTIQSHVRGHMQRSEVRKTRASAIRIQAAYRCYRERKRFLVKRSAAVRIQSTWKMVKQRREFKRMQIVLQQRRQEEAIRQAVERAERDARNESLNCIASGVIESLDVPEQLENALNNADKVNLNRNERNIHKLTAEQQTNLRLTKNPLKPLPVDVDQYAFSKFTNIYFNSHAWAMKREPIKTSFLFKSSNFEVRQSLTLFKLVLKFMNDHTLTEVREKLFLDFIINSALKHSYLRDELICQLVNQTWKNENPINVNRGWLLMANCLSAFCPSASLFKYLLKYLSDNAMPDCRGLLQQKLLNGDAQVARKYPPTYLEWTANSRKANMALNIVYPNNERKFCEVNSWSTGETVSNDLLTSKGITDSFGWSIDVEQENQLSELNGEEYLFDLVNEIENPLIANYEDDFYIFTQYENGEEDLIEGRLLNGHSNGVLTNGLQNGNSSNNHLDRLDNLSLSMPDGSDQNNIQRHRSLGSINEQIVLSKNSKLNKRYLREEESKELESLRFSETSKLNKRYTANASASNLLAGQPLRKDDLIKAGVSGGVARKLNKQQSMQQHSMSNLIDIKNSSLSKRSQSLQELGLATRSALNDRYFDKNASQSNSLTRKELKQKQQQDNLSSNSSIVSSSSYQAPQSVKPKVLSYGNLSDLAKSNEKAASNQLIKSTSSYWYKEKLKVSSSNYLNVKQKVPSSAMSDISETASLAPSLASHVRGVKAPTHASELDEYLDQLFNPVLDGNLDEMSDARSLAASIKGGGGDDHLNETYLSQSLSIRLDQTGDLSNCSTLVIEPEQVKKMSFEEFKKFSLLNQNEDNLCQLIKGGSSKQAQKSSSTAFGAEAELKAQSQKTAPTINTTEASGNAQSNPGSSQLNAFQNVAGMTVPMVDTSQMIQQQLVHQQMIQRAFLASAVQQNLQIQQQLLKQNQALQQLLSTGSSSESGSLNNSNLDSSSTEASLLLQTAGAQSADFLSSSQSDDRKTESDELSGTSGNRKDELKRSNEKIKILSNAAANKSGVPPAPPMPTTHSAIAYGSRAKTVRIGKVRWPPSRLEGDGCESTPNNGNKSNQSSQPNQSNPPNQFSYNCNPTLKLAADPMSDPTESAKEQQANGPPSPPEEQASGESSKSRQQAGRKVANNSSATSSKKEERLVITELRTDAQKNRLAANHLNSSLNNGLLIGNSLNANLISGNMNRSVSTNGINHHHHQEAKLIANSNVGKLRISSEMKAKLELLTINQSVRSTVKSSSYGKSDLMAKSMENLQDIRENSNRVNKLSKERKSLLEKQLLGQFACSKGNSVDDLSSPNQLAAGKAAKLTNCDYENDFKLIKSTHQQNFARESRERMDELGPHKLSKLNKMNQNSSASLGCLNFCYDCKKNEESNCKFYCRERLEYDQMSASMCNITDLNGQFNAIHLSKKHETLFGENLDSGHYMLGGGGGEVNGSKSNGHLAPPHAQLGHHNSIGNQLHQLSNQSTEESIKLNTKLYPLNKLYLTYQKVPWELRLRKELFSPTERIESPMVLNFIFLQIIRDAYSSKCLRMPDDEKQAIIKHLETIGIGKQNYLSTSHKLTVQKSVVQMARKMPLYFARFYSIINCKNHPDANQLAVSHSGLRLVKRDPDEIKIIETICFEDIVEITSAKENYIQILGKNSTWIHLISEKAQQIKSLIEYFIVESLKDDAKFVRAIADFQNPSEPTLLKFKKGDIIAISKNKNLKIAKGWYYGIHKATGESGLVSSKYVLPLDNPSKSSMNNSELKEQVSSEDTKSTSKADPAIPKEASLHQSWIESKNENLLDATGEEKMRLLASNDYVKDNSLDLASENNQTSLTNGKSQYSLLQFALQNFVQAIDKYELIQETTSSSQMNGQAGNQVKVVETLRAKKNKKKSGKNGDKDWTWKELSDLVKYSSTPLTQPLLKHSHTALNKISLECFGSIMSYMGDLKLNADQTEVDSVYNILVNCHKHFEIRDEVYCQLMKQTTSNKSVKPDSCQKGWRLFSIVTAYFDCSDNLRPFLVKYLETTAYDKRRAYHATALVCLQNFRKTLRFGGRKNVPSVEEILAISAGRNSKRQMYRLPGGSERVVNTKSSTVVNDVIEEICLQLDATSSIEQQEFSLYCIVEGDFYTMPINRDEYILDITTELIKNGQIFYLIFCRSVWYHPLRLDCKLYIEVIFNQVVPDYLEGLLLVLSSNKTVKSSHDSPDEENGSKLALDPNVNIFADFTLGDQMVNDICRIAALLHRAADMEYQPTKEEVRWLLPKPILPMKFMKPNRWVELVQENWADMSAISTNEAKAQALDCLSKWPLFGSCFFAVKHCVEYNATDFPEYILALNRNGAYFLDIITHETIFMFAYIDIISTRKVRAEDGTLFLDMKCGNLLRQSVTRIQTDQAHEISRLIRQYIEIQNHDKKVDPLSKSPATAYIQDV